MDQIVAIPNLYIGGLACRKIVVEHSIDVVIAITDDHLTPLPSHVKEYRYEISDDKDALLDLPEILEITAEIVERSLKARKRVLVHCSLGISRSATIVLHYLMKSLHFDYDAALTLLRQSRPIVQPNREFEKLLREMSL